LSDICRRLARRGHEVFVLFEEGGVGGGDNLKFFKQDLSNLTELEELIEKLKPDVANLHNLQNPYTVQKINQLVPTVRHIHDHRVVCPGFSKFYLCDETACPLPFSLRCALNAYIKRCATRRPLKLLEKMRAKPFEFEVNRALPKILVASEYMKRELVRNKFDSEKVVVMPQPIDVPSDIEIFYGDFILFVGRLTVEKGLKYLLQAMAKVSPAIKLQIVGDGPERLEDEKLTSSLGLSDRVTFTGWLPYPKVCELYAQCRFLVFPSVWPEPYGRTGPEATMFEKPVIGFNVGAVSEWLKNGENGFLLEPRDVNGLVEKINWLWNDLELTKKLGRQGRSFIQKYADSENYLQKLEELFDKIKP